MAHRLRNASLTIMSQPTATPAPLVSIIIPAFNKWDYTFKCLMAVAANTRDVPHEVIVVDNASSDETVHALPLLEGIRVQRNQQNLGFAKASNQGAAMARGKYLLFLNNDTEPRPGWLAAMVKLVEAEPQIAMVGSKLLFPDGTLQHAGVVFSYAGPLPVTPFHLKYRHPADTSQELLSLRAVTAACMLVRPEVFRAVGAFDEGFVNGYEDVDLCLKVWKTGAKIVYTPESVVVHHESISEGRFTCDAANVDRLNRLWMDRFDAFDIDLRREALAAVIDPRRTGASVIVPMYDAIWTLAPCLENLRYTTGAQDEIIVVDDGSTGAVREFAALFASRHPERVRLLRNDVPVGLPQAARQGLEAATRSRVVVMASSVRVVGDWLARLTAHLDRNSRVGALTPTLLPVEPLPMHELLYPVAGTAPSTSAAGPGAPQPGPPPGDVEETRFPQALLIYAERARLLGLCRETPETLFGDDQALLAAQLQGQGRILARARDVGVYKLTQIPGDSEPALVQRYVAQQSANLSYERRYADAGGVPPIGRVTAAQTELTSIVVVARDNLAVTAECLESILAHTPRSFELILVDNGSAAPLAALASALRARTANVTYLRNPRPEGYARACNRGLAAARGEYLALLHDDVVVTPGWLGRQLALMALDPVVGLTGPALSSGASSSQSVGMRTYQQLGDLPIFARQWAVHHQGEIAVSFPLSGACLVMRRQVVSRIGGFDSAFPHAIHADDDFCVRAYRANFRMAIAFDAFVHHRGAATFKRLGIDRKQAAAESWGIFCAKWAVAPGAVPGRAIRDLAAGVFDPARDRVPLDYDGDDLATGTETPPHSSGSWRAGPVTSLTPAGAH
jgi:GT2 family glycosyltransferase